MKRMIAVFGAAMLLAAPGMTGEWHSGAQNLCTDCHTMHFSMQHDWTTGGAVSSPSATGDGNWLGDTGPNTYLLKQGPSTNDLCLSCHNGQSFAPDVLTTDFNAIGNGGRQAGALNDLSSPTTMDPSAWGQFNGHTLGSTDAPPGYDSGATIGGGDPQYVPADGLQCVSCHAQHGNSAYRNLGPFSWGSGVYAQARPTYYKDTTNSDPNFDVWINEAGTYTPNTSTFANITNFNDVHFNRTDGITTGGSAYANPMDNFCSVCHGDFHGGPTGDVDTKGNVGGADAAGSGFEHFTRHPSRVDIGAVGGGHSSIAFYDTSSGNVVARVKAYTDDTTNYQTNVSPGCISCHKAHGNRNPFGLFLLSTQATTVTEEGGYAPAGLGTVANEMANNYGVGYQNLCGNCHTQGINVGE